MAPRTCVERPQTREESSRRHGHRKSFKILIEGRPASSDGKLVPVWYAAGCYPFVGMEDMDTSVFGKVVVDPAPGQKFAPYPTFTPKPTIFVGDSTKFPVNRID